MFASMVLLSQCVFVCVLCGVLVAKEGTTAMTSSVDELIVLVEPLSCTRPLCVVPFRVYFF